MKKLVYPIAIGIAVLAAGCSQPVATAPTLPKAASTSVGTEIDDTVVTATVKSTLLADQAMKGFEFKVETRKGVVQLSGFVDNRAMADQAIQLTRGVAGVKDVTDGMTIKDGTVSVGNRIDDGIVTARVKAALLADPAIKSADIAVTTRKGDVQLSGYVDNLGQIDRAVEVTRAVEGVQGVLSEMSVKK